MSQRRSHSLPGFSLVELLVVLAIIALMLAFLLPAVQSVRETAGRTRCKHHLHRIAIALHHYHTERGRFPAGHQLPKSQSSPYATIYSTYQAEDAPGGYTPDSVSSGTLQPTEGPFWSWMFRLS